MKNLLTIFDDSAKKDSNDITYIENKRVIFGYAASLFCNSEKYSISDKKMYLFVNRQKVVSFGGENGFIKRPIR